MFSIWKKSLSSLHRLSDRQYAFNRTTLRLLDPHTILIFKTALYFVYLCGRITLQRLSAYGFEKTECKIAPITDHRSLLAAIQSTIIRIRFLSPQLSIHTLWTGYSLSDTFKVTVAFPRRDLALAVCPTQTTVRPAGLIELFHSFKRSLELFYNEVLNCKGECCLVLNKTEQSSGHSPE